jgi:hypothetical protein
MKRPNFLLVCAAPLAAQLLPPITPDDKDKPKRLPDGTLQSEAILKEEQKRLLTDARKLVELSENVAQELEKNTHNVLSLGIVKKLEEIEKLARRMRTRHTR